MEQHASFIDRADAGRKLAEELSYLVKISDRLVVLSILNGGLLVGMKMAEIFGCPLDAALTCKLYLPHHPEVGFGAINIDGTVQLNHDAIKTLRLKQARVETIIRQAFKILRKRKEIFSQKKPSQNFLFKTVILVDDGITSGYTMLATVMVVKKKMPKKIIVAVPAGSDRGIELVKSQVSEVVCLYNHPRHFPFKIEKSYQNWQEISDQEAQTIFLNFSQGRHA